MRARLKGLHGRRILVGAGQAVGATFMMSLVLLAWQNQSIDQSLWLVVIGGVALGAGVYGILVLIMGVTEARSLLSSVSLFVRNKIQT
jgi:hypothetical protein